MSESRGDRGAAAGSTGSGVPRWVKVFGVLLGVLVVALVLVMLLLGGEHGPGRHLSSSSGPSVVAAPLVEPGPSGVGR